MARVDAARKQERDSADARVDQIYMEQYEAVAFMERVVGGAVFEAVFETVSVEVLEELVAEVGQERAEAERDEAERAERVRKRVQRMHKALVEEAEAEAERVVERERMEWAFHEMVRRMEVEQERQEERRKYEVGRIRWEAEREAERHKHAREERERKADREAALQTYHRSQWLPWHAQAMATPNPPPRPSPPSPYRYRALETDFPSPQRPFSSGHLLSLRKHAAPSSPLAAPGSDNRRHRHKRQEVAILAGDSQDATPLASFSSPAPPHPQGVYISDTQPGEAGEGQESRMIEEEESEGSESRGTEGGGTEVQGSWTAGEGSGVELQGGRCREEQLSSFVSGSDAAEDGDVELLDPYRQPAAEGEAPTWQILVSGRHLCTFTYRSRARYWALRLRQAQLEVLTYSLACLLTYSLTGNRQPRQLTEQLTYSLLNCLLACSPSFSPVCLLTILFAC